MTETDYEYRLIDKPDEGSVLAKWEQDGIRRKPYGSNLVSWTSPDEEFTLNCEVDDPVNGYLIRLYDIRSNDPERIGMTIADTRDSALNAAARLAAAAPDLRDLHHDPDGFGPDYFDFEAYDHPDQSVTPPDEWTGTEQEWETAVNEARDKADAPRGRPTLTVKTIDDQDYYYLQWRDGESIKSQYVTPVDPA